MKRVLMSAAAVAALTVVLFVGVPSASAHNFNCSDFRSQADAQAHYNADTSDPDGLDGRPGPSFAGQQGVACETQSYPQAGNPAIYGTATTPVPATVAPGAGQGDTTAGNVTDSGATPVGGINTGFGGTAPTSGSTVPWVVIGAAAIAGVTALGATASRLRRS